jgi:serine/threonine protein kinase
MKPLSQNTLIENRYLIVHLIGKGGMGEVYLAVDQRLGSAVALKRTYFAGDEALGTAFEREARTLARMRHPVLPKVSDHFGEGEEQFLVMEHIAGDDLSKRLETAQKPFPVSWVMFWADQLLDALSYLHSHEPPIIHRDIKPQNLKLTDENHIILLDFGLSKTTTGQTNISSTGSTGSVVGYTPHYAPMEQIRGIGTNARSDIYSLSATLYQLMTNVVPADALTRADTMLNGLPDPIEPPHQINPEVPTAVSGVILKGMEVSQEKRFPNAREMQKALRKAFTEMQDAMAAQTVAFNMGDILPTDQDIVGAVEKTQIMPSEPFVPHQPAVEAKAAAAPSLPATNGETDFDATLAFDAVKPSAPTPAEIEKAPAPIRVPESNNDHVSTVDDQLSNDPRESFVTVAAAPNASAFRHVQEPVAVDAVKVHRRPVKRSGGKVFAVAGGFAALLVLALGAIGAGWYYYNNYYNAAVASEPSPSPAPSPIETPLPVPVTASAGESNTNTDTSSNAESAVTTDRSTEPVQRANSSAAETPGRTASETSVPRAATSSAPKPNASRATTSVPKATPKPRTNPGRTDILQ